MSHSDNGVEVQRCPPYQQQPTDRQLLKLYAHQEVTITQEIFDKLMEIAGRRSAGLISEDQAAEEAMRACPGLQKHTINDLKVEE